MDINKFMKEYADKVGGTYTEYDDTRSLIIAPLEGNRFQTVIGSVKYSERYQKTGIEFQSKVCEYTKEIDLAELLRESHKFCYAKFVITEEYLQVEASVFLEDITDHLLQEIIEEVATAADEWEYRITGQDVH